MNKLFLTTTPPFSVFGDERPMPYFERKTLTGKCKLNKCYIDGEAEIIAGFDIPYFIEGDMSQLDMGEKDQQIFLLLPDREPIRLVSRLYVHPFDNKPDAYYLQLPTEPIEDGDHVQVQTEYVPVCNECTDLGCEQCD